MNLLWLVVVILDRCSMLVGAPGIDLNNHNLTFPSAAASGLLRSHFIPAHPFKRLITVWCAAAAR